MNTEKLLYRIRKGWTINFQPGSSLAAYKIRFFTNYPASQTDFFQRDKYREVFEEQPRNKELNDKSDRFFQVPTHQSGSFQFHFYLDSSEKVGGCGYFFVDPRFTRKGTKSRTFELDGVVAQTYLPKCLGDFSTWREKLEVCRNSNYNMIHFAPLQELGISNSSYSLRDQLKLNPHLNTTWDKLQELVNFMEAEWGILSMSDVVFNHTSIDSPWVHEHPECAYNLENSPHLRTAYLVDRIVWNITCKVTSKRLERLNFSDTITEGWQLDVLREEIWNDIHAARLSEFHQCNIQSILNDFAQFLKQHRDDIKNWHDVTEPLYLDYTKYCRFGATVNMRQAALLYFKPDVKDDIVVACEDLKQCLENLNQHERNVFQGHLESAVNGTMGNISYRFIQKDGPCIGQVRKSAPLMWRYFYHLDETSEEELSIEECEKRMFGSSGRLIAACNGWIMNDTPTRNFAEEGCYAYLKRDIVIWGDCIKLRYGMTESDCPYLWKRMQEYAEQAARIFHAIRLDNSHSTPLHVSQWLLDKARAVRNDLYIVAELFSGSAELDNVFMNKLGINSLIREAQSVNSSRDFGAMLLRFGGSPVGSFIQPSERALVPSQPHALLYDCTHDNPSPITIHCALDVLPTAALTSMAVCAIGSNRGYDEMVPHYIDVVNEARFYRKWDSTNNGETVVNDLCGIIKAKSVCNSLHEMFARDNYFEVFVDQVDDDICSVTRQSPFTRQSVILFAHNVFHPPSSLQHRPVRPIEVPGYITEIIMEATHWIDPNVSLSDLVKDFSQHPHCINGLSSKHIKINLRDGGFPVHESTMFTVEDLSSSHDGKQRLLFHNFPPGAVLIIRVSLAGNAKGAADSLHEIMQTELCHRVRAASTGPVRVYTRNVALKDADNDMSSSLMEIISDLTLVDMNFVLFRSETEDKTDCPELGTYTIPGYCSFVYCGLHSLMYLFDEIRPRNDLGHPLCNHIRAGDWLMHYITKRLTGHYRKTVRALGHKLELFFQFLCDLPAYLKPCYLDVVMAALYSMLVRETMNRFSEDVSLNASLLRQTLCANSVIFCGHVNNCILPPLHSSVIESLPPWMLLSPEDGNIEELVQLPTIAAGLPHFSSGIFRAWGRDTFISFRGLLLLTGRFEEARCLLLSYSSLLRHGLMPNLLGSWDPVTRSIGPRYNCRDAVWWWLYCIREYCHFVGDIDGNFLNEKVLRLFPPTWEMYCEAHYKDNPDYLRCPSDLKGETCSLGTLVVEALQRHYEGIDFVEWGAGHELDEQMTEEGFHVKAGIMTLDSHTTAGFPYGGNQYNCGTWMDKMGSSDKAGNRGKPATSRDGGAVELTGLCAAVVQWLADLQSRGHLKSTGVNTVSSDFGTRPALLTWSQWSNCLQKHFENFFWIPKNDDDYATSYNAGIYKDSVGSNLRYPDNHFRPNFLITMTVAPHLFDVEHAWFALQRARRELLGPLGMRTLAKNDYQYRGNYDNSCDTHDYNTAKGFNYHQGPEWLWPVGYYLRAYLRFAKRITYIRLDKSIEEEALSHVGEVIARLANVLCTSAWTSLPELTNEDGAFCPGSCAAQAWSVACLHEALYDLIHYDQL